MKMKSIVFALALMLFAGLLWRERSFTWIQESALSLTPLQMLEALPVQDLILQEATFDIITKARLDEDGNPLLYFASGGAFGKGASKVVLFRGCVRVRYGVDLKAVTPETVHEENGVFLIRLPEPRVIGNPIILTDDSCQSRILDIQGEGWWAGYVQRADIQTRIHQQYAKEASKLCEGLGLEQKTKAQAEQVLIALLQPLLDKQRLTIHIQWGDGQPDSDETPTLDIEKGASNAENLYDDTSDICEERALDILVRQHRSLGCMASPTIRRAIDFGNGPSGNVEFYFAGTEIRALSNGGLRPAGS